MYLFLMITGFLFVIGLSILLKNIYELFSINKFTKFISPTEKSIFNTIGIIIIPNILWAFIEFPLVASNYYYLLGFLLNIFVSMATIYVIEYGMTLIKNNNSALSIVAIIIGSTFGFVVNYLCLLIGIYKEIKIQYSLLGLLLFIIIYIFIKIKPPENSIFKQKQD